MITLIKALLIGFIIGMLPTLPGIELYFWVLGLLISIALSFFLFIWFGRSVNQKIMPVFEQANRLMQNQQWKQAVEKLESMRPYSKQMFLLSGQIDAQIGTIYFYQNKEEESFKHLTKATSKNWYAMLILCHLYFKKKKIDDMIKTFEFTVKLNSKEELVWNAYAFCLLQAEKLDEAISVLNRASKKMGPSPTTDANIISLKNQKRMNMKPFGETWYSLKFEKVPRQMMQKNPNHPGYRGFRQKKRM